MGIKGLAKLLSDEAPDSIREIELKSLHGRKVAIDASMAIYQFLIAVRSGGNNQQSFMLTNADGETTSHIQGMFNRTIRYMTEGIRPAYVFDGKPPNLKSHELVKRREKREKAQAAMIVAQEEGNVEELDKQSKRLVRAGTKENLDCQKLLNLMGIPVIQAPCEAEAQASYMAKTGLVYATGTEDMDALTFQTPILIRKMTFANATKAVVQSVNYSKALEGLQITHAQFVDLCIMLGCDYCDTIRGVGPKTALKLIREHKTIEMILQTIDRKKFTVPDSWIPNDKQSTKDRSNNKTIDSENDEEEIPTDTKHGRTSNTNNNNNSNDDDDDDEENTPVNDSGEFIPAYVQARKLFLEHEVQTDIPELKWKPCDPIGLTKFLVDEMGFNIERVTSSIDKLQKAYTANTKPQTRMDSFFKVVPSTNNNSNNNNNNNKTKTKTPSTVPTKGSSTSKRKGIASTSTKSGTSKKPKRN